MVLPLVSVSKSTLELSWSFVKCKRVTARSATERPSEVEQPRFGSCCSYLQCLPTLKAPTLGPCFIAHTSRIPLRGAYMTRNRAWRLGREEDSWSPRSSWTCSQPNWASRYPAFKLQRHQPKSTEFHWSSNYYYSHWLECVCVMVLM